MQTKSAEPLDHLALEKMDQCLLLMAQPSHATNLDWLETSLQTGSVQGIAYVEKVETNEKLIKFLVALVVGYCIFECQFQPVCHTMYSYNKRLAF